MKPEDHIPDVRDGLSRVERVVLWAVREVMVERGLEPGSGRTVPTAEIYGRVVEHLDLRPEEVSAILARLGAMRR
ncbi:MAG: hypothetical protein U1E65_23430 [Myxococcota bacterium]